MFSNIDKINKAFGNYIENPFEEGFLRAGAWGESKKEIDDFLDLSQEKTCKELCVIEPKD